MCMVARGIKKVNAKTITSKFTGAFQKSENKSEFYSLLKN